jgi:hypothetical protein
MAIEARTVVSVSYSSSRKGWRKPSWRVRTFRQPADWNAMGITLDEQWFRARGPALKHAQAMAAAYAAEIQGGEG